MGFFKKFDIELRVMIQNALPLGIKEQPNFDFYARKWIETVDKFVQNFNWVDFFDRCTYIDEVDEETLYEEFESMKILSDFDLGNIHKALIYALKQHIDNNLENEPITQKLHEYYLMTKKALNPRMNKRISETFSETDAFHDYLINKKKYIEEQNLLEYARTSGKVCPYCKSTKIKSDGHSWRCKVCGKYWRKH